MRCVLDSCYSLVRSTISSLAPDDQLNDQRESAGYEQRKIGCYGNRQLREAYVPAVDIFLLK